MIKKANRKGLHSSALVAKGEVPNKLLAIEASQHRRRMTSLFKSRVTTALDKHVQDNLSDLEQDKIPINTILVAAVATAAGSVMSKDKLDQDLLNEECIRFGLDSDELNARIKDVLDPKTEVE